MTIIYSIDWRHDYSDCYYWLLWYYWRNDIIIIIVVAMMLVVILSIVIVVWDYQPSIIISNCINVLLTQYCSITAYSMTEIPAGYSILPVLYWPVKYWLLRPGLQYCMMRLTDIDYCCEIDGVIIIVDQWRRKAIEIIYSLMTTVTERYRDDWQTLPSLIFIDYSCDIWPYSILQWLLVMMATDCYCGKYCD